MKNGFISLYRKAWDNFLYKENRPHTRREAWEDIIAFVNHEDSSVLMGNEKIECKRGQSIRSLESWGKIFKWDKSKVRRFFSLLSKETMIVVENMQKTTRITVCNYELYQGGRNVSETRVKRERHQTIRNNNDNKSIESVEKKISTPTLENDQKNLFEGNKEVILMPKDKNSKINQRGGARKKTTFDESDIANLEDFKSQMNDEIFAGINVEYYYHRINNWSRAKGAKNYDWTAFSKNWIMDDIVNKKVRKIMPIMDDKKYLQGYD